MNYKSLLAIVFGVAFTAQVNAQANILNAKDPDQIGFRTEEQKALDNDKPLEYGYVDDRDIMFAKMTWEKVVLDERVNFPLYYPVDTNNIGSDRRSLFDALMKAVDENKIEDVYTDSYFTSKKTKKEIAQIRTSLASG